MKAKRIYGCSGDRAMAAQHPSPSAGTGANREAGCSVYVGVGSVHFCHFQFRYRGSLHTNPHERMHEFVEGVPAVPVRFI